MSEYTNFVKVGSTACLLKMMEDDSCILRDLTLENQTRAIREISHDITCRRKIRLASGRELSALDIQREILDKALRYADTGRFDAQELKALEMWEHCISTIENDPLKLNREVDWVIKYHLVEAFRERHELALDDPRVQLVDLQYHDICRDRGLFYKLERNALVNRICNNEEIELARALAPQTTRAKLRGDFIKRAKEKKRDYTVDWVHLKLNDQAQRTVLCKDPFKYRDERVEKLIASL
jgi:proteasome accessory factor A